MGYEIFLWNCHEGERILVYRWEPEMPFADFNPYHKEKSDCGEITEFEKKFGRVKTKLGSGE
ncbi:hypothetical protein [Leptospira ellisii]|nr:hypothetical protein [Leptospira ellisii]